MWRTSTAVAGGLLLMMGLTACHVPVGTDDEVVVSFNDQTDTAAMAAVRAACHGFPDIIDEPATTSGSTVRYDIHKSNDKDQSLLEACLSREQADATLGVKSIQIEGADDN